MAKAGTMFTPWRAYGSEPVRKKIRLMKKDTIDVSP